MPDLPHIAALFVAGASLALSGGVMQALFHNPLASPSVLGISSGASLSIVLLHIAALHHLPFALPLAGCGGALAALVSVYALARRIGRGGRHDLLLVGIALSTLLIAIQGALLYALRTDWNLLTTLMEWEAGATGAVTWFTFHKGFPLFLVGTAIIATYTREIDLLSLGEEEAFHLGVDVRTARFRLFLAVSLLIGATLSTVGNIAFVGLLVPHLARLVVGPRHSRLLPASFLVGGLLLPLADIFLRTFAIEAFSLGHLFGMLGGLTFFALLARGQKAAVPG